MTPKGWSSIRRSWAGVGRTLRRLAVGMWITGLVLMGLGLWIDSLDWWTDRPFLSNLSSSLAGVLFGTPFALLVIQRVSAAEAEHLAKRSAILLMVRATRHLSIAARVLVPSTMDTNQIALGLDVVERAQQSLRLGAWQRREAYDQYATNLHEFADWYGQAWSKIVDAIDFLAAGWSIWKSVTADRVYVYELDVIDFRLIGNIDSTIQRLRELMAREPSVPSGDQIAGISEPGDRIWGIGNLLVADEIAERMTGAAASKERDIYVREQLSEVLALLRAATAISELVQQLQTAVDRVEWA